MIHFLLRCACLHREFARLCTPSLQFLASSPELKPLAALPASAIPGGLNLVEEIFEKCLFALPEELQNQEPRVGCTENAAARLPKCKSVLCRRAAFNLLLEMARGCPETAALLCQKALPHHDAEAAAAQAASSATAAALMQVRAVWPLPVPCACIHFLSPRILQLGTSSKAPKDGESDAELSKKPVAAGVTSSVEASADASTGKAAAAANARRKLYMAPRSSTGYVGLLNLGCICYMNATMQQFFMTPRFRKGVLSWIEPQSSTPTERADSIMLQMQRMFANLQESEKQYYNPRSLCAAIKDWEGNPTDPLEQKDVPEFLTKLFADMESQCQGSPLGTLVKDVYGTVLTQELIADDPRGGGRPQLRASRDEDQSFLQVHIKNNPTLVAAIDSALGGETVDYKWELPADAPQAGEDDTGGGGGMSAPAALPADPKSKPAEATVKSIKRLSLKHVSDHIMFNLNRFEFDFETMQQASRAQSACYRVAPTFSR